MFHVLTPDTMMLTLRTIRSAGRVQLSVGMIAYFDLTRPYLADLLPCSALQIFRRKTSWLRHLEAPLSPQGSQCAIFGLAYAPKDAARGAWRARATVGALHASATSRQAAVPSDVDDTTRVPGIGPIRLSAKAAGQRSLSRDANELIGNESITIHHMHPHHAILRGKLPGLRARCFIKMRLGSQDVIRKLDSTLEKLWLFPNDHTGVVRYRALMPLDIVGGTFDIERLVAGWEAIDAPNTSASFYIDLLNNVHQTEDKKDLMGNDRGSYKGALITTNSAPHTTAGCLPEWG